MIVSVASVLCDPSEPKQGGPTFGDASLTKATTVFQNVRAVVPIVSFATLLAFPPLSYWVG